MNTITILSCLTCQNYWSNVANVYSTDLGFILGLVGTLGVIVFLVYFLFSPIKRDTQLVKKNYWFWVLVFMVTLIFAMQLWGVMYHVWEQIPSNRHHSTDNQTLLRNILHFFIGSLALPQELQRGGIPPTVMLAIKVFIVNGISIATIVSLFNRRITHYREGQILVAQRMHTRDIPAARVEDSENLLGGDVGSSLCTTVADHAVDVGIGDVTPSHLAISLPIR